MQLDLKVILDPSPDLEYHSRAGVARLPNSAARAVPHVWFGGRPSPISVGDQTEANRELCLPNNYWHLDYLTSLSYFDFSDFHLVAMRITLCLCILD